ncbi:MAG: lipoate--protein ligase [Opitutales bacterium]|nr:lipoate--protein ligase [Opitutales bacterium]
MDGQSSFSQIQTLIRVNPSGPIRPMEVFVSPITDSRVNLGLESFFLNQFEGEGCLVYRNAPSVVIGKNQNPYKEVDVTYCKSNGIDVIRRESGGGAVYHDLGNINTAFFGKRRGVADDLYCRWTKPPISFLESLGVDVERDGRNGLEVDGRKVSGSAQTFKRDRFLHHATLLCASDLVKLEESLSSERIRVRGQSVESYRSPVENLMEYVDEAGQVEGFLEQWVEFLCAHLDGVRSSIPSQSGPVVQTLVEEQFSQWEWNVGRSPKYQFRLPIEDDCLVFSVIKGNVDAVHWEESGEDSALSKTLSGKPFSLESLRLTSVNTVCPKLEEIIF